MTERHSSAKSLRRDVILVGCFRCMHSITTSAFYGRPME